MSEDRIGVQINGVLYVKFEDAKKLREGWDKADREIEKLRAALSEMVTAFYDAGCHICGGDCASANPPVGGCPVGVIRRARAALGEKE